MQEYDAIVREIGAVRGKPFHCRATRVAGGGCINRAIVLEGDDAAYFVKLNDPGRADMFTAEFAGLEEIRGSGAIRVPAPLCHGIAGGDAFLVLECLELSGRGGGAALGHALATMHRETRPAYGWDIDNTIGSTPQPNRPARDWVGFWRENRLGFQLELAAANGHGGRLRRDGERLLDALPALLPPDPPASLLHGDLWAGNHGFLGDGTPVIFDPAVYYGDRETDLAMTELFGGYPADFYRAYAEAWPLDPGYATRKTVYNLYHVLNHLNLFGGGYLGQAERMIAGLLAEVR